MDNVTFKQAFMYPFNRAQGLLNIFWLLVPIYGWFLLGGYSVTIVKDLLNGNYKQLPQSRGVEDFKLGFWMFLKFLPFLLAYIIVVAILIAISPKFEILTTIIEIFVIPLLLVNFFKKETIKSSFEFEIIGKIFDNFVDYLVITLKTLLISIVFLILLIVLVGLPALSFGTYIFYAQFYRNHISNEKTVETKKTKTVAKKTTTKSTTKAKTTKKAPTTKKVSTTKKTTTKKN